MTTVKHELEPLSISINMAVIKKTKFDYIQILKKLAVFLVIALTVVGVIAMFSGGNSNSNSNSNNNSGGLTTPQVRSPATTSQADPTGSKDVTSDQEGRLISFQLGNLKKGGTGTVTIRTRPSWAPLGVSQFHTLVDAGFYDGCRFFRVVNNFMVQFGINGDPEVQKKWRGKIILDDPVVETNRRGTVTFATSGPDSRTTQMFINTNSRGNKFLDSQGFSPIGEVIEGMEFVDQIYDEYKERPDQGKIQKKGNAYLNKEFPNLSYIVAAKGT